MKLTEAIKQAVERQDATQLGKCVDVLRFRFGMNYEECRTFVNKHAGKPLSAPQFEALMYEADTV